MKNQMSKEFHDVSTYVKQKCEKTYRECVIVMMGTLLLILSSLSTISSVDKVESAAVSAENVEQQKVLVEKAVWENQIALAKEAVKEESAGEIRKGKTDRTEEILAEHQEEALTEKQAAVVEEMPEEISIEDQETEREPEIQAPAVEEVLAVQTPEELTASEAVLDASVPVPVEPGDAAVTETAAMTGIVIMGAESGQETSQAESVEAVVAQAEEVISQEMDASGEAVDAALEENAEVTEETETMTEPVNESALSASDYDALCRIVQAEAGGEGEQGKMLVASVVMNRVADPAFPTGVESVIVQEDQFSPVENGSYQQSVPDVETLSAVNRVLAGENVASGALYFKSVRSNADWSNRTLLYSYGNHNFYL